MTVSPIWMGDAAQALRTAAKRLEQTSDTPRLDAELLLAHALNLTREKLLLDLPSLDAPPSFTGLIARREQSEPVAHIVGMKEFWGLSFLVTPDVLIPRPDSELIIEAALELLDKSKPISILDLGTGSGALLLSALSEFPNANGVGMDASAAALMVAHNNADRLNLSDRASFVMLDWTQPHWGEALNGPFDLILANPPYIASDASLARDVQDYEPHQALFAGQDGLDDYHIIIPAVGELLAQRGVILLEIGFDQRKTVTVLANQGGFLSDCKKDLGQQDRLLILSKKPV